MDKGKVQQLVNGFVTDLVAMIEGSAKEELREKLQQFSADLGVRHEVRVGRPPGKSTLRPCPIQGCRGTAAPRFGGVCREHKDLPRDQKILAREHARQPGGVWFKAIPAGNGRKRQEGRQGAAS